MTIKKVQAHSPENYVVDTEVEGFNYTLDYSSRNPNSKGIGATPTGLLLSALAGCQLMTARSYYNRHKIHSTVLEVDITGDFSHQSADGWKLKADVVLTTDANFQEGQTEELKQFIERYCTVSGVLSSANTINLRIEKI